MKKQTRTHVFFVVLSFFILTASTWLTSCSSIKKRSWNEAEIVNAKYKGFAGAADAYLTDAGFQGAVLVGRGISGYQIKIELFA